MISDTWNNAAGVLHRCGRGATALCGEQLIGLPRLTQDLADYLMTAHGALVCQACEAVVHAGGGSRKASNHSEKEKATLAAMKQQRERNDKAKQAVAQDKASAKSSSSVRAIGGGLPTLGRRGR